MATRKPTTRKKMAPKPDPFNVRGAFKRSFLAANPGATPAQRLAARNAFNNSYKPASKVASNKNYSRSQVSGFLSGKLGYGPAPKPVSPKPKPVSGTPASRRRPGNVPPAY